MKKKILAVALGLTLCFGMTGCTSVVNIDKTIKSPNSKLCDFEVVETNFYGAILVDKILMFYITGFRMIVWHLFTIQMEQLNYTMENNMIDNELRQQYRQAVDDLKIAFKKTCLYRFCEEGMKRLSRILN